MAVKRNYIEEILEIRSRSHKRADRWQQFTKRNVAIIRSLNFLKETKSHASERKELLKYISIGMVACVETYFRMAIRDLIDAGLPFNENLKKLQEIKFDLVTILNIKQGKISPGEMVAHLLPLNNLEDINRNVSLITGKDFLEEIKDIKFEQFQNLTTFELVPNLYEIIKDMFSERHIFCHEVAMKIMPTFKRESEILGSSILFTGAAESFILRELTSLQKLNIEKLLPLDGAGGF
jgi:hypothetical protein